MSNINWHSTSNMSIQIIKVECPYCDKEIYALDDHEVDVCIHCGKDVGCTFDYENEEDKYWLIVDPKTGLPSVVEQSGGAGE